MAIKGLIFDFDGTLAELNIDFAAMRDEVKALARSLGHAGAWPADGYLLEQVAEVAPGLGDGFVKQAQEIIVSREVAAAQRSRLFPFTLDLLQKAGQMGLKVAIISRNCGEAIRQVFPDIDSECQVFLPREAVKKTKPDPAHVLAALEVMGLEPAETALVGDHPLDVKSARAAGCLPVGVASGRMKASDLAEAGARIVLPDASRLLGALELG